MPLNYLLPHKFIRIQILKFLFLQPWIYLSLFSSLEALNIASTLILYYKFAAIRHMVYIVKWANRTGFFYLLHLIFIESTEKKLKV